MLPAFRPVLALVSAGMGTKARVFLRRASYRTILLATPSEINVEFGVHFGVSLVGSQATVDIPASHTACQRQEHSKTFA